MQSEHLPAPKTVLILILGSLTAFGPLPIDMYLPALPKPNITNDLNVSTSLVQMSLTATLLGLGFGQLIFGPLSDILGRHKPLTFTLIALSPNITFLIFFRSLQGFTGAAGTVIARAAPRNLYSGKDLTKFTASLALVDGVAPVLAPVYGGIVLHFTT